MVCSSTGLECAREFLQFSLPAVKVDVIQDVLTIRQIWRFFHRRQQRTDWIETRQCVGQDGRDFVSGTKNSDHTRNMPYVIHQLLDQCWADTLHTKPEHGPGLSKINASMVDNVDIMTRNASQDFRRNTHAVTGLDYESLVPIEYMAPFDIESAFAAIGSRQMQDEIAATV